MTDAPAIAALIDQIRNPPPDLSDAEFLGHVIARLNVINLLTARDMPVKRLTPQSLCEITGPDGVHRQATPIERFPVPPRTVSFQGGAS